MALTKAERQRLEERVVFLVGRKEDLEAALKRVSTRYKNRVKSVEAQLADAMRQLRAEEGQLGLPGVDEDLKQLASMLGEEEGDGGDDEQDHEEEEGGE